MNFSKNKFGEKLPFVPSETVVIDFGNEIKKRIPNMESIISLILDYRSLSETYDAKEAMFNLYDLLRWAEIQSNSK